MGELQNKIRQDQRQRKVDAIQKKINDAKFYQDHGLQHYSDQALEEAKAEMAELEAEFPELRVTQKDKKKGSKFTVNSVTPIDNDNPFGNTPAEREEYLKRFKKGQKFFIGEKF